MRFDVYPSERRSWRERARGCGLALLLAAPLLARGAEAPLDFAPSGALGTAPETALSFSALYEENRDLKIGDFVTVDLLAHAVTRLWHDTLHGYEEQVVAPRLGAAVDRLLAALATEPDAPATRANRDFLQLLAALLAERPAGLSESAAAEYRLVLAAEGETASPLFGYRLDYSQFAPRGAYAASEARRRFFRAYRYAATALFPLAPSAALGLDPATGRRLLDQLRQLARLGAQPEPDQALAALQAGIADLLPGQPASVDLRSCGKRARGRTMPAWGRALLKRAQRAGRQPRVLHARIDAGKLEPGLTARDAATGYRFAPLLEALDSQIFQRLVYDATGAWRGPPSAAKPLGLGTIEGFGPAKVRPLADEWVAALGVAPLQGQLAERGETAFERAPGLGRPPEDGDRRPGPGRAAGQAVRRLFEAVRPGLAAAGGDGQGHVGRVQARRAAVSGAIPHRHRQGSRGGRRRSGGARRHHRAGATGHQALRQFGAELAKRLPEPLSPRWNQLGEQLRQAETLAEARVAGKPLSLEQQAFLRGLPKRLDALAGSPSEPLVVDIHTGTEGREPDILHAATGFARETVATVDGQSYRGARYRFFGFRDRQRWTDEAWRKTLAGLSGRSERQSWRLKSTAPLVRAVVLARAGGDERPQPVEVVLVEAAAGAQLDAWAAERKLKVQHQGVRARLELPLSQVPALAQQPLGGARRPARPADGARVAGAGHGRAAAGRAARRAPPTSAP